MSLLENFDASQIEPSASFEILPEGEYLAAITQGEEKPTANGTGKYLSLTFEILEGEHKGRKLWENFNLVNANADAVRIAQKQLSAVCHAINVLKPRDVSAMLNIPLTIKVGVQKRKDTGEMQNKIKNYSLRQSAKAVLTGPQAPWAKR